MNVGSTHVSPPPDVQARLENLLFKVANVPVSGLIRYSAFRLDEYYPAKSVFGASQIAVKLLSCKKMLPFLERFLKEARMRMIY
jgi:hypothetical protein